MKRGIGTRMVNGVIYNVYDITNKGITFLSDPRETLLPAIDHELQEKSEKENNSVVKTVTSRYILHVHDALDSASHKLCH